MASFEARRAPADTKSVSWTDSEGRTHTALVTDEGTITPRSPEQDAVLESLGWKHAETESKPKSTRRSSRRSTKRASKPVEKPGPTARPAEELREVGEPPAETKGS